VTTSQQAIQNLYESPWQVALCLAGGGSRLASDLLTVPGASTTVLDVAIPYANASLSKYLGQTPDQFCSRQTAMKMATVAWQKAMQFSSLPENHSADSLGVSCTASLASTIPKRGDHRIWIATESASISQVVSLILKKGLRSRAEEEIVAADLLLYAICEACKLPSPELPNLHVDETVAIEFETVAPFIAQLRTGRHAVVWALPGKDVTDASPEHPRGLLPGSFNPLHVGHRKLRCIAEELIGGPVYFELSLVNADKPPLNNFEIEQRRHQFDDVPLALTAAPLFVDKARLFPGTTFVIGYDTAARIIDQQFYNDSAVEMHASLEAIGSLGCCFLVAGRLTGSGFQSISKLPIPSDFHDLFTPISEKKFREDISSSGIRNAAKA
jgi:hypothetical protein